MSTARESCPMTRAEIVDRYFMEHRAKVLDIAGFLDRIDRSADGPGADDFRMSALRQAIGILLEPRPGRARRILELFSDPTTDPIASAAGMKGAFGAYGSSAAKPPASS